MIVAALNEGMDRIAISGDRSEARRAARIAQQLWRRDAASAPRGRLLPRFLRVVYPQRDIVHAISMPNDVAHDGMIGSHRRSEHEANFVLLENIGSAVARAGFRAAVRREPETESRAVEVRGLASVAYVEFDVIGAVEGQKFLNWRGLLQHLLLHDGSSGMLGGTGRYLHRCPSRPAGNLAAQRLLTGGR